MQSELKYLQQTLKNLQMDDMMISEETPKEGNE